MNARWRKVLIDLWSNKARSLLVILSIAVGVFAVGVVASSYAIVKHDMAADYEAVNPHTARIFCDEFDAGLVAELASTPGVASLEGRTYLSVRIAGPDGLQHAVDIDRIAPLDEIRVDQLVLEAGSRGLGDGEIYLERQGAAGLGLKVGDPVDLRKRQSLQLYGQDERLCERGNHGCPGWPGPVHLCHVREQRLAHRRGRNPRCGRRGGRPHPAERARGTQHQH